jgi:hypothetical protein
MVRREQLANDAESTLNGGINAVVTSLVLADGSNFPSEGNFRILIDNELMIATARSTNTLTVVRGAEGTSAATHSNAATVTHIITKEGLLDIQSEALDPFSNIRSPYRIVDTNEDLLTHSSFTQVNAGSTTWSTDANGNISAEYLTAGALSNRLLVRSAPTPPYTIRAAILMNGSTTGSLGPMAGIGFRENSSGELHLFANRQRETNNLNVFNMNSPTSFNASPLSSRIWSPGKSGIFWLEIEDDNTDLKFHYSIDGVDFSEFGTIGRTSFMAGAPDEIHFFVDGFEAAHNQFAKLVAWSGE